ncbi:MAG: transposase, partial [Acidobacteriaceae bacterium]
PGVCGSGLRPPPHTPGQISNSNPPLLGIFKRPDSRNFQTPLTLEMENRIKEQMCLFAYRLSTEEMKGNQLRLYLSALAYTLVEALRRLALKGTEWAQAQVDTIRLKLFKVGALVRISARRVWLELSTTYPWKQIYARAFDALRC